MTDIPHETFLTYDGGYDEELVDFDNGFARCIVFEKSVLKSRYYQTWLKNCI